MTPGIIVTCDTITSMWYDISLIRDKFLFFLKTFKKIKKNSKKIQKIQKLTHDTPFNTVTTPLTERT